MGLVKLLCFLLMFFSLAQPAVLFPSTQSVRAFFFLSLITAGLFFVSKGPSGLKPIKIPQNKFIYGILVTYTLSTAQFMWLPGTIDTFLFWFKKILLYYLIINIIRELKDLKKIIWSVILAVTVLSLMGWNLYLNNPHLLHDAGRLQAMGNYNLSNSFALLLALTFPLAFTLMEIEKNFGKKFFLLFLQVFFIVSCVFTKSRGGTLGLLIGVMLCIIFSRRILKAKAIKIIILIVLMVAFLGYGVAVILSRTDITDYAGHDSSAGDRLLAWRGGIQMVIDHPLFGVGWGLFNENIRSYGHNKKILAHNTPLSVLAETGILGFIFFVAILYYNFKQLLQMKRYWYSMEGREDFFILSQGIFISLICFLINTSFSVKDHDPIYWAILSLSGVLCGFYIRDREVMGQTDTLIRV